MGTEEGAQKDIGRPAHVFLLGDSNQRGKQKNLDRQDQHPS